MISKILFVLTLSTFGTCNLTVEVTSGVHVQRLPNMSFYQLTRPILFQYRRPVSLLQLLNCSYLCKTNKALCEIESNNLTDYFSQINLGYKTQKDDILMDDGEIFDFQFAARNHVTRLFSSDNEIELLIERITGQRQIPLHELFYQNPFRNFSSTLGCVHSKLAEYALLDNILLFLFQKSIVYMCQSKKLQLDIVPMVELSKALKQLHVEHYSPVLKTTSAYYNFPLVECTLSPNLSLIGLHVPLIHNQLKGLHMRKMVTPNFAWENYTCAVKVPALNVALVEIDSQWTVLLPKCDPFKDELCLVTDNYDNEALGIACIKQVLIGGSVQQLSNVCPLSCEDTGKDTQFLVSLGLNKYLVTHPNPKLQVHCPDSRYALNASKGALLVTLPCNCYLKDYTGIDVKPTYACQSENNDKLQIQLTIPAAWTKLQGLKIPSYGATSPRFATLDTCLNENWLSNQYQNPQPDADRIVYYLIGVIFFVIVALTILGYFLYQSTQRQFLNYLPLTITPRNGSTQRRTSIQRPTSLNLQGPPRTRFAPPLPVRNPTPENAYLEPLEATRGYIPLSQLMQSGGSCSTANTNNKSHTQNTEQIYTSTSEGYITMDRTQAICSYKYSE